MIDSSTVRGHVSASGGKEGLVRRLLVDRTAVLRAKSDNQVLPIGFILTGGEASDMLRSMI
jgi:hypothetical protein